MTNKLKLIPGFALILICLVIFLINIKKTESRFEKLHQEYPALETKDSLNNIVLDKFNPDGFKYSPTSVFITLDNGHKYCISARFRSDTGINDVVSLKCFIIKQSGNDTIRIKYGQDDKGYFILKK